MGAITVKERSTNSFQYFTKRYMPTQVGHGTEETCQDRAEIMLIRGPRETTIREDTPGNSSRRIEE